jgi:NhaP-type Na+/H+ or K+/H+ antiporter
MVVRVAVVSALAAFSLCLLVGGLEADNPFTTTVWRALVAMAGTLVIGLVIGEMARRMIEESVAHEQEKSENNSEEVTESDR